MIERITCGVTFIWNSDSDFRTICCCILFACAGFSESAVSACYMLLLQTRNVKTTSSMSGSQSITLLEYMSH